jgi:phosphoribosyl 1,2-cyclic phosphodiesterase/ActR/RegA family two-component response regulator
MRTVLIIDSDAEFRKKAYRWLLTAGWRALEAEDGEQGLALTLQHQPEVVVCDLLVPRVNGFQLFRNIRSQRARIRQPVLIAIGTSAYASDRQNALDSGADRYLVKPFRESDLVRVVEGKPPVDPQTSASTEGPAAYPPFADVLPGNQQPFVRFWGVRGSIPTPGPSTVLYGGNTSCVELRADGEIVILDAGTGIRGLGLALAREFQDQPIGVTVLLTHTHWDHIQGFPFFVPAYHARNQIRVVGYEGARHGLLSTLSAQMESSYFPVSLREMTRNLDVRELRELEFCVGRIKVQAMYANHPQVCVGYRLHTSAGSVAYFPDHEPHQRMRTQDGPADQVENLRHASLQDQKLIEFLDRTDLLVMDAQYDDAEYQKRVGWGHGCLDDVVALAMFARVRRLVLFHHDPDHADGQVSAMLGWARELVNLHGDPLVVEAAREGLQLPITLPQRPDESARS